MSRVSFRPRGAQGSAQQTEGRIALRVGHLLEADALAHVEMLVHPLAPFRIVDREHGPGALLRGQARQEALGGIADCARLRHRWNESPKRPGSTVPFAVMPLNGSARPFRS